MSLSLAFRGKSASILASVCAADGMWVSGEAQGEGVPLPCASIAIASECSRAFRLSSATLQDLCSRTPPGRNDRVDEVLDRAGAAGGGPCRLDKVGRECREVDGHPGVQHGQRFSPVGVEWLIISVISEQGQN